MRARWQRLQLYICKLSDWIRRVGKPWSSGLPADFQMASSPGFGRATGGHLGICSKASPLSWLGDAQCSWRDDLFSSVLLCFLQGPGRILVSNSPLCSSALSSDSRAMSSTCSIPVEMIVLQCEEFHFGLISTEKALFCKLQVGCHMPA